MFEIWKDSIFSRFYIEAFLLICFTGFLQYMKLQFVSVKGEYTKYASIDALLERVKEDTGIQDKVYLEENMQKYISSEIC